MRKPNYNQDRLQRERDKAAKAEAKELRRQEQRAATARTAQSENGDNPPDLTTKDE